MSDAAHLAAVKNLILHYISMDETMSPVSEFRETIFTPGRDHKMLLHSLGLDTKILLDTIGYSSLSFNWATLRGRDKQPLERIDELWSKITHNFREDVYAREQVNGEIPDRLSGSQERAIREVINTFERNLGGLYLSPQMHLFVFGIPPTRYYTNARMGYGGYPDVRISPLFEIITDPSNPHPSWNAMNTAEEMQYHVVIVPEVFKVPLERWLRVRELRPIVNLELEATEEPLTMMDNLRRKPIGEYLALLTGAASRNSDIHSSLQQIPAYLMR